MDERMRERNTQTIKITNERDLKQPPRKYFFKITEK